MKFKCLASTPHFQLFRVNEHLATIILFFFFEFIKIGLCTLYASIPTVTAKFNSHRWRTKG